MTGVMLWAARGGLFAALAASPLAVGGPMNLALGGALALTLLLTARGHLPRAMPPVVALSVALTAAAAVSAVTGIEPWCGFAGPGELVRAKLAGATVPLWCGLRGFLDFLRATALFWLVVQLVRSPALRRGWLALIVAVAAVVATWGTVDYALGNRTGGAFLRDPGIGHSNHTAAFLVIVLPTVALATRAARGRSLQWLALLTLTVGVVALALTQSLAGWASAGVVAAIVAARLGWRPALVGTGTLIGLVVLVVAVARPVWAKLDPLWLSISGRGRLSAWWSAVQVIADHPLFGIGPRSIGFISPETYGAQPRFHAHNLYLNLGAELGLVGLGLFLAVLAAIGHRLWRTRASIADPMDEACWYGACCALLALAVLGLATTPYHSRIAMMFWAIVGLFYAQFADRPGGPAARVARAPSPP